MTRLWSALVAGFILISRGTAQPGHLDLVTPFAPELARYGPLNVGVRTTQVTDRDRPDVLNTKPGAPTARYDRTLTLEIWYPAALAPGQKPGTEYRVMTRDPRVLTTLYGQAVRDAAPATRGAPYPLVILSHGYPGNRFILGHLGENLASKGYVVVSIDHRDSTYDDLQNFASTLYNRPYDQLFVLREIARLGGKDSGSFLAGIVDANRTGLLGYSMGGYGAINVIGGGFTAASAKLAAAPPNDLLAERSAAHPAYLPSVDPRIVACVAVAPWGMAEGYWDAAGLHGIRIPLLLVAGSRDTIAGYEKGPRAIFQAATNSDRHFLTFINASHNAAAPIPAPPETLASTETTRPPFAHYADPVWDTVRMNNIFDHFVTAFFDWRVKGDQGKAAYFDLPTHGDSGPWKGFRPGTSAALILEHAAPSVPTARPAGN